MFVEWLTQWEFFFLSLVSMRRSAKMRTKMKKVFFMKFLIFLLTLTCAFGCACVYNTWVCGNDEINIVRCDLGGAFRWNFKRYFSKILLFTPCNIIAFSTVDLYIFSPIDFDDVIRKLLIWLLVVLARDKQYLCHHIAPNEKNCFCFRQGTICFLLWNSYIGRKTHSLLQSFDIEDIYCHFSHSSVLIAIYDFFCMHFML